MKRLRHSVFLCLFMLFAGAALAASDAGSDQSDSSGKQWSETMDALGSYTADQKDKALAAGKKTLDAMDRRIDELEAWTSEHWDSLSEETRERKTEMLSDMRRQRNKVAEWYGGMKHSSADAWDGVKQGFIKSYDKLQDTVRSFQSEENGEASD